MSKPHLVLVSPPTNRELKLLDDFMEAKERFDVASRLLAEAKVAILARWGVSDKGTCSCFVADEYRVTTGLDSTGEPFVKVDFVGGAA